jgi:hypothetical protein
MKTPTYLPILGAGSDQANSRGKAAREMAFNSIGTVDQMVAPSMAMEHAVPGIMPEVHVIAMQHDQAFWIQTLDGAMRHYVCLNGAKATTPIIVYFTPDDEDGCEVFSAQVSTPRESGRTNLYLGSGVLAGLVERSGKVMSNYQMPHNLEPSRWSSDIIYGALCYAMDAVERLALGYNMPSAGFQVVSGPKDFQPVKFQLAAAQRKGGKQ